MSGAPVCHISTNQRVQDQPPATVLPTIPVAIDLPSAIRAINLMTLMLQMITGQMPNTGPNVQFLGFNPFGPGGGGGGGGGSPGGQGQIGPQGQQGPPGPAGKTPKSATGRWVEVPGTRIVQKKRIYQDNDNTSPNYVDINQINYVQWQDSVTKEIFTWSRGADGTGDTSGDD